MTSQNFKEQFFSQIYEQNIEKIYRFAFFKTSSELVAQDIASEAFSRLWVQIKKGVEIKNPQAFLYKVTRNLLIDYYRKRKINIVSLDELTFMEDKELDIEDDIYKKDDLNQVKVGLASLNDNYRQVISLYYIEQESISDIAKSLGKSEGATRVLLHRGMKKLKKHLES